MCLFWGVYLPLNRKWPHLSFKSKGKIIDNLRTLWKVIKSGNGSCSVTQSCLTLCDPWIAARQASLSFVISQSSLTLMSIKLVMPSNHFILSRPLLFPPSVFPSIRVFSNEFFASGGQSIGISASTSVLPMNTQYWSPLGWTGWISLQPKGLSRVFSNTTVQKHQFFDAQPSLWSNSHNHTWLQEKP